MNKKIANYQINPKTNLIKITNPYNNSSMTNIF